MTPRIRTVPAHPLDMPAGSRRTWRIVLILLAGAMVGVLLALAAISSALAAREDARFDLIPAGQELGRPTELELDVEIGSIAVRVSPEARAITLRMTPADGGDRVRARLDVLSPTGSVSRKVHLAVPRISGPAGWAQDRIDQVELIIPEDLAGELVLSARTGLGDVTGSGGFAELSAGTSLGDVTLRDVSASGALAASTELGDVSLALVPDAAPRTVRATSSLGDVLVRVPGQRTYQVAASSVDGTEAVVTAGIRAPAGQEAPGLTASTQLGTVLVTR